MLATDLTELQPGTAPAPEDVVSCRAAAEAWAAESRLSMPEFRRVYVERCVDEIVDQHPAWLRVDAERLVLSEATWLDDCAA